MAFIAQPWISLPWHGFAHVVGILRQASPAPGPTMQETPWRSEIGKNYLASEALPF